MIHFYIKILFIKCIFVFHFCINHLNIFIIITIIIKVKSESIDLHRKNTGDLSTWVEPTFGTFIKQTDCVPSWWGFCCTSFGFVINLQAKEDIVFFEVFIQKKLRFYHNRSCKIAGKHKIKNFRESRKSNGLFNAKTKFSNFLK